MCRPFAPHGENRRSCILLAPVVAILLAAVLVVVLCRLLRVPAMLGYLLVGFIVGPGGLQLIADTAQTRFLGEIGIVFLMFTIGLEFSLPKLRAMRHIVFGLGRGASGGHLVGGDGAGGAGRRFAADWLCPGLGGGAVVHGDCLRCSPSGWSSTPRMVSSRLACCFQDLAVVPLLILIPPLPRIPPTCGKTSAWRRWKVMGVMVLLFSIGQRVMRPWFHLVARQRSSELFMINVLLVTLGVSYLTELSGLSLALGRLSPAC